MKSKLRGFYLFTCTVPIAVLGLLIVFFSRDQLLKQCQDTASVRHVNNKSTFALAAYLATDVSSNIQINAQLRRLLTTDYPNEVAAVAAQRQVDIITQYLRSYPEFAYIWIYTYNASLRGTPYPYITEEIEAQPWFQAAADSHGTLRWYITDLEHDSRLQLVRKMPLVGDDFAVIVIGLSDTYFKLQFSGTRYFPGASVQGAEIDKKIADIATDYFGLPGSVTVAVEDGRAYLAASKEKFDVIMVDAYQDITIPFQLSSVEFFNEVQAHLKPNGVMVVNLNMTSAENGSINEYLCDTMASVFQHTVTAPVKGNTNTEVFCTNADDWEETFLRSITKLKDSDYADMMRTVYSKLTPYEGGSCILTDDKAPVEVLGMRVLDELIGDELNYYKDELRTGGLSALIGN